MSLLLYGYTHKTSNIYVFVELKFYVTLPKRIYWIAYIIEITVIACITIRFYFECWNAPPKFHHYAVTRRPFAPLKVILINSIVKVQYPRKKITGRFYTIF